MVQASHFACDISDGEAFSNLISTTTKEHGKLDILINNAGVTRDSLLMRMKEDQWDEVLNINLKGAFHGMKAAIRPMMKKSVRSNYQYYIHRWTYRKSWPIKLCCFKSWINWDVPIQ